VSWSLGRPDGQGLSRDERVDTVRRIVSVVDVPVTADVEGGYGESPEDVARTVAAVIGAGAVGVNIEDSRAPGGPLFDAAEQAARLRAGRAAAAQAGLPELVINVRTDVFLFGIGAEEGRLDEVIARTKVYAEAGADSLFVPGLVDLGALATLVRASPLPVNVMAWPGAPTVAEFESVGVRRVSVGTAVSQAAYTVARRATAELLTTGTYTALADALDFGTINSAVTRS
jgi:2-methylisocitrate lyase-like PEP mutase family enzyme